MNKLRSYVLPFAIVMGILFHRPLTLVKDCTPYIIFSILLLNNVAVDMKKLRLTRLDWWVALFQIFVSLGSYFLFKLFLVNDYKIRVIIFNFCNLFCVFFFKILKVFIFFLHTLFYKFLSLLD